MTLRRLPACLRARPGTATPLRYDGDYFQVRDASFVFNIIGLLVWVPDMVGFLYRTTMANDESGKRKLAGRMRGVCMTHTTVIHLHSCSAPARLRVPTTAPSHSLSHITP